MNVIIETERYKGTNEMDFEKNHFDVALLVRIVSALAEFRNCRSHWIQVCVYIYYI